MITMAKAIAGLLNWTYQLTEHFNIALEHSSLTSVQHEQDPVGWLAGKGEAALQ